MSITVIKENDQFRVLEAHGEFEEGKVIQFFTGDEISQLEKERRTELDLQMPSFIRGDEDESAEDLFPVK
ncbi:MAG: hypothetical protein ABI042_17205 [Verrucomicrobiota bacterium]